jgi:hypothetical protein
MITESQIREQLAMYLDGSVSFEEFEDWFIDQSWDSHLDSSQSAQDLVSDISLLIYEYLDERIEESGLKEGLRSIAETYEAEVPFVNPSQAAPLVRRSSSSRLVYLQVAFV